MLHYLWLFQTLAKYCKWHYSPFPAWLLLCFSSSSSDQHWMPKTKIESSQTMQRYIPKILPQLPTKLSWAQGLFFWWMFWSILLKTQIWRIPVQKAFLCWFWDCCSQGSPVSPWVVLFPDTISKDLESAHNFIYKGGMFFDVFYIYLHGISAVIVSPIIIRCSFL